MNSPLALALIAVACLAGIGLYGLLLSRNLIKLVIALQVLVKATVLALVMAGEASGQINLGQSLAATFIAADTVVAVVGLALAVRVKQSTGTLDVQALGELRG